MRDAARLQMGSQAVRESPAPRGARGCGRQQASSGAASRRHGRPALHVAANLRRQVRRRHVLAVERHEIARRVCAEWRSSRVSTREPAFFGATARCRGACCSRGARTDEVHDDGMIHQVVRRVVRLVVVDAERARRRRARVLRPGQPDEPRVELCRDAAAQSRGCSASAGEQVRAGERESCGQLFHTFHVVAHLLDAVALRVNGDEHRLHLLPRLLLCAPGKQPERASTQQHAATPLARHPAAQRAARGGRRTHEVHRLGHLHQLVRADVWAVREAKVEQREASLQVRVAERLAALVYQLPGAADGRLARGLGRRARQQRCGGGAAREDVWQARRPRRARADLPRASASRSCSRRRCRRR